MFKKKLMEKRYIANQIANDASFYGQQLESRKTEIERQLRKELPPHLFEKALDFAALEGQITQKYERWHKYRNEVHDIDDRLKLPLWKRIFKK